MAGLTEDGAWVRWYPVRFRDLPKESQFSKYDWVEARVVKSRPDTRSETFVPEHDSIRVVGSMRDWARRRSFILPHLNTSVEALQASGRSLGMIRPAEMKDFDVVPDTDDWTAAQKTALLQGHLFSSPGKRALEKIPFKFYYKFTCSDDRCKGHRLQFIDWEVFQAHRGWRHAAGSEAELVDRIRRKFHSEFMSGRDTYLYLGTPFKQHHYGIFMVIGLFYPPVLQGDQLTFRFGDGLP